MPPKKTHYDILGVPRSASEDLIKRKYRELVRLHHPDVAQDKAAATSKFIEIQEAYQTLINPDRRLIYDASLDGPKFAPRGNGSGSPGHARPPGSSAGAPGGQPRPSQARPSQGRTAQAYQAQANRVAEAIRWVREAESAFSRGQFRSAIWACKEAQRIDPKNVTAHIILGDVYRIQGQTDEAITMYTIAVQLDPRNADVLAKLDRLIHQSAVQNPVAGETTDDRKASLGIGMNLIGWSIVGTIVAWLHWNSGTPLAWFSDHLQFVNAWSATLVGVMLVVGIIIGFLLSMTGSVRRLDDELVFQGVKTYGRRSMTVPVGLIMIVMNLFSFYIAALMYFVIGIVQESLSKSVLKALGIVVVLTFGIALSYPTGTPQVLIFGGNVVFPAMLVGWGIGDICRPDW